MKSGRFIRLAGMTSLVAYLALLLIITTVFKIMNIDKIALALLIPLLIVLFFISLLNIGFRISYLVFSYCYIVTGVLGGHTINTFFMCVIYRIFSWFISFSTATSLIISIGISLVISIYGLINGIIIQIERITLTYPNFGTKKKICHLSDLHLGSIYQNGLVERIVNKILLINPDIVVITGDMADGSENVKREWLQSFNCLSIPILYITGNHEMLMGKSQILKVVGETNIIHIGLSPNLTFVGGINFLGVDYDHNLKQRLSETRKQFNPKLPTVLLTHVPKLKPEDLKEYNIFLNLAGHTHGGQIFPFQIFAWFCNSCFKGLYSTQDNNHHVYVSTGLGGAIVPMRIFSSPVIGEITIQSY